MRHLLVSLTIVVIFLGCGGPKPDPAPTEGTVESTPVGDEVRGVAQNAKDGAVLLTPDGRVVYIFGLDTWPEEALNKEVVARGTLEERDQMPAATEDQGAIASVSDGDAWYLKDADWEVAR